MNVLGVDPSLTCTGVAKVTSEGLRTLRIPTKPDGDGLPDVRRRVRYIVGIVLGFAPGECVTVIEAPYVPQGGKQAGSVIERAWLWGLLVDQLVPRGHVVQVRTKTRAKYATGNGNADKKDVLAAVRESFPGTHVPDDNVADALALAAMGARWGGAPIDGALMKGQVEAMTAVAWPLMEGARG